MKEVYVCLFHHKRNVCQSYLLTKLLSHICLARSTKQRYYERKKTQERHNNINQPLEEKCKNQNNKIDDNLFFFPLVRMGHGDLAKKNIYPKKLFAIKCRKPLDTNSKAY